jgi:pSer/pThr/pTyr-binding forkhead associated (FHA) protein
MAFLYEILSDGTLGEFWTLGEKPAVVGRGEFADIYVEDGALSRSHFLVVREGQGFFVVDLDSQNGTWLGRERVSGRRLRSGDVIQAGQSRFCFSERTVEGDVSVEAITAAAESGASSAVTG